MRRRGREPASVARVSAQSAETAAGATLRAETRRDAALIARILAQSGFTATSKGKSRVRETRSWPVRYKLGRLSVEGIRQGRACGRGCQMRVASRMRSRKTSPDMHREGQERAHTTLRPHCGSDNVRQAIALVALHVTNLSLHSARCHVGLICGRSWLEERALGRGWCEEGGLSQRRERSPTRRALRAERRSGLRYQGPAQCAATVARGRSLSGNEARRLPLPPGSGTVCRDGGVCRSPKRERGQERSPLPGSSTGCCDGGACRSPKQRRGQGSTLPLGSSTVSCDGGLSRSSQRERGQEPASAARADELEDENVCVCDTCRQGSSAIRSCCGRPSSACFGHLVSTTGNKRAQAGRVDVEMTYSERTSVYR